MRNKKPEIEYNPVCDLKHMHGYRGVRWVENASRGLRLVGYADKIADIDHKGWFIRDDDDGASGEVYRGVVYQLPSRCGQTQFAYGYADPCNEGAALLCFDLVHDKHEAAYAADNFAEIMADGERDYDRAWQAGSRYRDLDDEIKESRREALAIGAEMRAARISPTSDSAIYAALREKILSLYHSIVRARKERAELVGDYGNQPGFEE